MAGYWKSSLRGQFHKGFFDSWETVFSIRTKSPKHVAGLILSDMGQWLYKAGARAKDNLGGGLEDVGPRYTYLDTHRRLRQLETFGPHSPTLDEAPIFFAPTATIQGDVKVGKGSSFWFNSLVRAQAGSIEIGENVHIMERAIVKDSTGTDNVTQIGNYVVIEQGAIVEGASLQDGVRVGAGAIVMPGSVIGEGTYIKPNTVVLQNSDIQFESIYGGVPAARLGNANLAEAEAFHKAITTQARRFHNALSQQPKTLAELVALAQKYGITAESPDEIERKAYDLLRNREKITDIWPNFVAAIRLQEAFEVSSDDPTMQ